MTIYGKYESLKKYTADNYFASRIVNQIGYALKLSAVNEHKYDERITEAVAATLDTFGTMLYLMNEYTEFAYSQSQASVYKIVEEHGPEYGIHTINIGLAVVENYDNRIFAEIRNKFIHTMPVVSGKRHAGVFPLNMRFFKFSGDVLLSGIKTAEESTNGKIIIFRLYDANGKGTHAKLEFSVEVLKAYFIDINENKLWDLVSVSNAIDVDIPEYQVISVAVEM